MGPAAVQFPLIRGWRLVAGIIAVWVTGVFTWAQMDYNLITSGWLPAQEVL